MDSTDTLTVKGAYGFEVTKPEIGMDTEGKESFADIVHEADVQLPPALQSAKPFTEKVRIAYDRFHKPEFVELEKKHIWTKMWQVACRVEDIPEPGDRISYDITDLSFIIVRQRDGGFKAFYNSCPHRSRKLCNHAESGLNDQSDHFRCPFHAWTWDLEGNLEWVPAKHDFPHVTKDEYRLREVQCDTWGGNVFINPDPDAVPLRTALGKMNEIFADFPLENRYTVAVFRKHVRCNWKIAQEAFMEAYHVVETHWDGMPFFGSAFTRYDNWSDEHSHTNRLTTPGGVADVWVEGKISPFDTAYQHCSAFGLELPREGTINTIDEARAWCADAKRRFIKETYGKDYADAPDTMILEMTKCFVFPNHHPWWGEAIPWWYRFLPYGTDPDKSIMEVRVTAPIPEDGRDYPKGPPPVINIDFDTRTCDVPELGTAGTILDQDMQNMEAVQQGLKTAPPGREFMTLATYQESNIRHFHHVYNMMLGLN